MTKAAASNIEIPPQDLVAERAVLGSIILENRSYDDICDLLDAEHFYSDVHQQVYLAICKLIDNGHPADIITVANCLDESSLLDEVGGAGFICDLLESVAHSAHALHYAKIVRDKWTQRQLQSICQASLRSIREGVGDGDDVLESHENSLFGLADQKTSANKEMPIWDVMSEAKSVISARADNPSGVSGVSSGYPSLDAMTNGFHEGTLSIVAARPAMGKTSFICNLIDWFMINSTSAMLFSMEQSKQELAERLICIQSRVDGHAIRKGHLTPVDRHSVLDAASTIAARGNLFIDDTAGRSMAEIRSICRRVKRKYGLQVIVIDYLQLIEPEDKKANREVQVATISRRLKGLAKDMKCPVICLSQLNRAVELREDKRPKLADLRESGAIEQDADIVMFLHRPGAYNPEDRPNLAEVIIAKHRSGPVGIIELTWKSETMRFEDGYAEQVSSGEEF